MIEVVVDLIDDGVTGLEVDTHTVGIDVGPLARGPATDRLDARRLQVREAEAGPTRSAVRPVESLDLGPGRGRALGR